ncbi:LINE-1 reverse transcriptase like, partial [Trifolium medium]|nr:LINE-1 reverse transcriptase like [Trifolium medium]
MQVDIMRFISEFPRNGKLTRGINSTFIALIPKVDSPQKLNDFRPISLVGSIYKILAKVLANRLQMVIGSVISEVQSAFIKDRQILDGILIANEVVDEARKYHKELLLFKVDFEKAYDSVDWSYLDTVMCKMSFSALWRKWIKECVSTATTSVLVNGSPTDEFPLERGLRQGDPLSPFLFLLAAEGLNVMMRAMVQSNVFTGYSVGAVDPTVVSHLQFADDNLILGVKSWANVRALRAVLVLFETVSRLKVNFNKSMLVGVNIAESWLAKAASVLGCVVGKVPFVYLGLAIGGDPRRLSFWVPVLTRIKSKLSGRKSRFLSYGGRLILLKFVLTSLPVYAFSFFKAPS